jgi:hypothetical protein
VLTPGDESVLGRREGQREGSDRERERQREGSENAPQRARSFGCVAAIMWSDPPLERAVKFP